MGFRFEGEFLGYWSCELFDFGERLRGSTWRVEAKRQQVLGGSGYRD